MRWQVAAEQFAHLNGILDLGWDAVTGVTVGARSRDIGSLANSGGDSNLLVNLYHIINKKKNTSDVWR